RSNGRGQGKAVLARVRAGKSRCRRGVPLVGVLAHAVPILNAGGGVWWLVREIRSRHRLRRVIPRRQVKLDGRRSILPLRGIHANGKAGCFGFSFPPPIR